MFGKIQEMNYKITCLENRITRLEKILYQEASKRSSELELSAGAHKYRNEEQERAARKTSKFRRI